MVAWPGSQSLTLPLLELIHTSSQATMHILFCREMDRMVPLSSRTRHSASIGVSNHALSLNARKTVSLVHTVENAVCGACYFYDVSRAP